MRPSRRNHVVITFIEFLSSAKHLACCQHNLGLAMPMVEPPSRPRKAFFDINHAPADQSNRRTDLPGYAAWEIHPVMKIETLR
jgi:hypothetical protein